jgi:hypothetical protein
VRLTAIARYKTLNQEFKVLEIDLQAQRVKCEGEVERKYCVLCDQIGKNVCPLPWFRIGDVELTIKET